MSKIKRIVSRPCPFCGSNAMMIDECIKYDYRKAVCTVCGASSGEVKVVFLDTRLKHYKKSLTEDEIWNLAIGEWNKRAGEDGNG